MRIVAKLCQLQNWSREVLSFRNVITQIQVLRYVCCVDRGYCSSTICNVILAAVLERLVTDIYVYIRWRIYSGRGKRDRYGLKKSYR